MFLHTLCEAAKDPDLAHLLPDHLQGNKLRILILCPPSLIINWIEELHKWLGQDLLETVGKLHFFDLTASSAARLCTVKDWSENGGVLILGYQMFRTLVSEPNKNTTKIKKPRKTLHENQRRKAFQDAIFTSTSIVVADEAHMMKRRSILSQETAKFDTRSRIALSGSPLANNLGEYYQMIEWVDPYYLGDYKEFRSRFENPIKQGLYKDCQRYVFRKALKLLRIFGKEIAPKVNRANIDVLKGTLKPKVEFVLTIQLTDIQKAMYSAIIRTALSLDDNSLENMSNAGLWKWLGLLLLVVNHPAALRRKIQDKDSGKSSEQSKKPSEKLKDQSGDDEEDDSVAEAMVGENALKISPTLLTELKDILEASRKDNRLDSTSSIKTDALLKILKHAKEADDRVLVFSHSIPTLDFLETLMQENKFRYLRFDGKTPPASRQPMAKKFNKGSFEVFLISTRAGGTGLNLPGANRIVIMDYAWNPTWEVQAVGRAYRIGQEKEVFVYRFITAGTYEKPLWDQSVLKLQLADRAVDKKQSARQAMQAKEYLFMPTEDLEAKNLDDLNGKDTKVLDKLLKLDAWPNAVAANKHPIKAIETTEVLQRDAADEQLTADEEQEADAEYELLRLQKENPDEYARRQLAATQRDTAHRDDAIVILDDAEPTFAFSGPPPPVGSQNGFQKAKEL